MFKEGKPKEGGAVERPHKLSEALKRRRSFYDKIAKSPWTWTALAVLALENEGCAAMGKVLRYAALEPDGSRMRYDYNVGFEGPGGSPLAMGSDAEARAFEDSRGINRAQIGPGGAGLPPTTWYGPRASLEFFPRRSIATIPQIPEGFYDPAIAKAIKEGRMAAPPPGFISLPPTVERPGMPFAVVHGSPRARTMTVTVPDKRPWHFGTVTEQRDVETESRVMPRPGVSDEERLQEALRHTIRPEEMRQERAHMAARGLSFILPRLGKETGIRLEWLERRRTDQEHRQNITLSCRLSPWGSPSHEAASQQPERGQTLEHEILSDSKKIEANELVYSSERSADYPQRPAQVALATEPTVIRGYLEKQIAYRQLLRQLSDLPDKSGANAQAAAKLGEGLRQLQNELDAMYATTKIRSMAAALSGILPQIQNNDVRLYVRWDPTRASMQVFAFLDNPVVPKD